MQKLVEDSLNAVLAAGAPSHKLLCTLESQEEPVTNPEQARKIVHDLNNVFTRIVSTMDLVLDDLPKDASVRRDIQTVLDSSSEGVELLETLRNQLHL